MNSRALWILFINLLAGNLAIYALMEFGLGRIHGLTWNLLGFTLTMLVLQLFTLKKFEKKVPRLKVLGWSLFVAFFAPFGAYLISGFILSPDVIVGDLILFKFIHHFLVKYLTPPLFMLNLVLYRWLNRDEYATEPL